MSRATEKVQALVQKVSLTDLHTYGGIGLVAAGAEIVYSGLGYITAGAALFWLANRKVTR